MPPKTVQILPGITVDGVAQIAEQHGVRVDVRPVAEIELRSADEVWLSSSGRDLLAIVSLDGSAVGSGQPGPMYRAMYQWFLEAKRQDAAYWESQRKGARKKAA